ncbi:MAG: AbrB/MazE/SpoVT family DNA-binding domain-containing protein [Anaerovoracaceae bacterium]
MELAKITSKGQITIPIQIRNLLRLDPGDKVVFIENNGTVEMINESMIAFKQAQQEFSGVAEEIGVFNDEAVVEMVKTVRRQK